MPFAELHCHSNFSFLDGASSPHELVERASALGMSALAVTDHDGLYGAVRFSVAAIEAGIRPIVGMEVVLRDTVAVDPGRVIVQGTGRLIGGGQPQRPRAERKRLPGHREAVREDLRGIRDAERGPHLVLLARSDAGYRSLCRLASRAHLAGTKGAPRYDQALLAEHVDGLIALSGCRHGQVGRRLLAGDRVEARRAAEACARLFGSGGFFLELQHHLLPDDDWLVAETVRLADETGIPVVVTNDAHYAAPEGRELQDVLVAIRHGLTLETSAHLRRPNGEYHLKGESELLALPPADLATADPRVVSAWREGIERASEIAEKCSVDLGFEHYRFPGFEVPKGETPFSYLETLCHDGARRRYHPMTPPVVKQLAHELEVIERTGLAEFFLICWDLMRFAREQGIPAQGRGSAGDSIVAYVLGITRVDPIRHRLLFERFINEGRTTYPDIDIDFASSRREEVIQYVYQRYGEEHTGMVCNLVTYRARSAVREVGLALGFPAPLVDRVAKALETYDSVMVRRDLEAEGGFAHFFAPGGGAMTGVDAVAGSAVAAGSGAAASAPGGLGPSTESIGFTDHMGRLNHRADPYSQMGAPEPRPARDDKGGPGDSAASVRRLRGERSPVPIPWLATGLTGTEGQHGTRSGAVPTLEESSQVVQGDGSGPGTGASRPGTGFANRPMGKPDGRAPHSSVARVEPEPERTPRGGSTVGLSPWERWLELCARISGFPRHLSIHVGGMLVTAAPLIDIAPLERATMPGRVVVQYDKRDVEDLKLIKLDLLGLRMLSAIDEALQLIEADCGVCIDLDRLPEEIPAVFRMLQAADTVGVFQVESRAQMQTLPKSRPTTLDDLVVEVAIIRPGPIQGNAVHPYLRRRQGVEPVAYLHPSLEPVLRETLGVILYQEQVMEIAIRVAGFSAAESDGFRRAMGTWRSSAEMEKLHARFVDGCIGVSGLDREQAEELYRQVAAFASFGFNKSHAAAFARTAYESAFLKLFYPAQFVVGLINAQPMGFYPVEVLVNDARRHGVAVLPVDVNRSRWRTTSEWIGLPGEPLDDRSSQISDRAMRTTDTNRAGAEPPLSYRSLRSGLHEEPRDPRRDRSQRYPLGTRGSERPVALDSPACVVPTDAEAAGMVAPSAQGFALRLGLHLVKGIGEEHQELLDREFTAGPYRSLADVVERTGLGEETIERLIRAGALDSLGEPRRRLLWQLREVAGVTRGTGHAPGGPLSEASAPPRLRASLAAARGPLRLRPARQATLHLPPTDAPELAPPTDLERMADSYAVLSLDARRQVVELFRSALGRLGAVTIGELAARRPGRVRIGGLVVTRQHPMTAKGTVFLALEDETGMANVTLWPDAWARLRGVVRRHALLLVDGTLQRESNVVNVVAREVRPLTEACGPLGGPEEPRGVRHMGHAGMRRH